MPVYRANQYRELYNLGDEQTMFAGGRAEAEGFYGEQLARDAASGIAGQAMANAKNFEQAWRGVWARIGTMAEGGESKLLTALTAPMQKFSDWLDKNSGKLNDAITKIADAVGNLTTAWVDDLDKVNWPDVAKDFEDTAKSIAHFVAEMAGLVKTLVEFNEQSKEWWFTKLINRIAGGTEVTPLPSGDGFWASHGPGVGGDITDQTTGLVGRAWNGIKSFFGGGPPTGVHARARRRCANRERDGACKAGVRILARSGALA